MNDMSHHLERGSPLSSPRVIMPRAKSLISEFDLHDCYSSPQDSGSYLEHTPVVSRESSPSLATRGTSEPSYTKPSKLSNTFDIMNLDNIFMGLGIDRNSFPEENMWNSDDSMDEDQRKEGAASSHDDSSSSEMPDTTFAERELQMHWFSSPNSETRSSKRPSLSRELRRKFSSPIARRPSTPLISPVVGYDCNAGDLQQIVSPPTPIPSPFLSASGETCILPRCGCEPDLRDMNCIDVHTVAQIIKGKYDDMYDEIYIIDGRFQYEYEGGHVQSATNITSLKQIIEIFFNEDTRKKGQTSCVIFHCEFSSVRGPRLCRGMRKHDREINQYPLLCYPEVYLMAGGYSEFYKHYPHLCSPMAYVCMDDKRFSAKKKLARSNRDKSERTRSHRSLTSFQ